jgi:hypothetical protein
LGKGGPAHKPDNLTVTCEPTVYKMWEPLRLATQWASTDCYGDIFTFYLTAEPRNGRGLTFGVEPKKVWMLFLGNIFQNVTLCISNFVEESYENKG